MSWACGGRCRLGKEWVAGYWREQGDQWQWVPGFWTTTAKSEEQQVILPPRPRPRRAHQMRLQGPSPIPKSFWVPGCWVWNGDTLRPCRAGHWAKVSPRLCLGERPLLLDAVGLHLRWRLLGLAALQDPRHPLRPGGHQPRRGDGIGSRLGDAGLRRPRHGCCRCDVRPAPARAATISATTTRFATAHWASRARWCTARAITNRLSSTNATSRRSDPGLAQRPGEPQLPRPVFLEERPLPARRARLARRPRSSTTSRT